MTTSVQESTFETEVLQSTQPVLVDFWAPWCGPCRAMSPVVDDIAEKYDGRARVLKVDVDEAPAIAGRYGISSIPSFFLFKDGEVQEKKAGVVSRQALEGMIESQLN